MLSKKTVKGAFIFRWTCRSSNSFLGLYPPQQFLERSAAFRNRIRKTFHRIDPIFGIFVWCVLLRQDICHRSKQVIIGRKNTWRIWMVVQDFQSSVSNKIFTGTTFVRRFSGVIEDAFIRLNLINCVRLRAAVCATHHTWHNADSNTYTTEFFFHKYSAWLSMLKHSHVISMISSSLVNRLLFHHPFVNAWQRTSVHMNPISLFLNNFQHFKLK